MNDNITILLIIAVSVVIIILYISIIHKDHLRNYNSLNSKLGSKELFKNYTHKIIENKDLSEADNLLKSELSIVRKELLKINKDSIYAKVYILENILSKKDCLQLIYASEKHSQIKGGWKNDRHEMYPTHDIDIRFIQPIGSYIYNIIYTNVIPQMAEKFDLNLRYLGISEIFIVKYCKEGQTKLVEHQDGQAFSFIIPLNKDYVGGGTKFKFLEDIIDPDIGNCTIFCGKHHHKGIEIKTGERYILAGFLSYGFDDQNI